MLQFLRIVITTSIIIIFFIEFVNQNHWDDNHQRERLARFIYNNWRDLFVIGCAILSRLIMLLSLCEPGRIVYNTLIQQHQQNLQLRSEYNYNMMYV